MVQKTNLPEELTEIAIDKLKTLLIKELSINIISIIFFGSRQKGKFTPDSDIDILIIVKDKNSLVINKIFDIADEVERNVLSHSISLSIHVRSFDEYMRFKNLKSLFMEEVEREGRVIYARKTQS
jgi:predicted nucleotidyltransferase